MFTVKRSVLSVSIFSFLLWGISSVTAAANAPQLIEARPLATDVTDIDLHGAIDVVIKQGTQPSMKLHATKEQLAKVVTKQSGNKLSIGSARNGIREWLFNWGKNDAPISVEITLPSLQKIAINGSGDASISGFKGDQMTVVMNGSGDVDFNAEYRKIIAKIAGSGDIKFTNCNSDEMKLSVAGSGDITASGKSRILAVDIAGAGSLDAQQLVTDSAALSIAGAGDAKVFAKQSADVSIAGVGNVTVLGAPVKRHVSKAGIGNVTFE